MGLVLKVTFKQSSRLKEEQEFQVEECHITEEVMRSGLLECFKEELVVLVHAESLEELAVLEHAESFKELVVLERLKCKEELVVLGH